MAEAASPKRPTWFWPVIVVVVLVLAAGGFAAPSVLECSSSESGFGACINSKLAGLGLAPAKLADSTATSTSVAVAQPAETVEAPPVKIVPPDFGVRVEPNGSIVIAGSGATGKTVQIFVNGELYGTASVEPSGDWVLVPDAPLPPGGYELTVVDPETGKPFEKAFVVAINEDKTSEPLVVASVPGKASEVLQGLIGPAAATTSVAEADLAQPAPETTSEPPVAVATAEPVEPAAATSAPATNPVATQDQSVATDAQPATVEDQPAATAVAPAEPPAEIASEPAATEQAVATAEEDVVGDVDALSQRIDALAQMPPSIDAVEIDKDRNFFAGTGANGAIIRVYVDNVFVGDTKVANGRWLLETGNVLKNRSQRVRADQLMPGTADVVARAEIDFIFEAPQAGESETAVAEAPVTATESAPSADTVPSADEPVAPATEIATAETPSEPATKPASVTEQTSAPAATEQSTAVAEATTPATTAQPETSVTEAATTAASSGAGTATNVAATAEAQAGTSVASAGTAGTVVGVPEPDFSIDTGIPVTVVTQTPAETPTAVATSEPSAEPVAAASSEPQESVVVAAAEEPPAAPVAEAPVAPVAESDVPKLVAIPFGEPEFGRFVTGKAIIRSGDNLWTIARRVYGSGYKYTQIYGANRDQIRDPDLIYPGQVFNLPDVGI